MTPAQYFYRRLWGEIVFQYKVVRMVADWSVLVYIGIPGLAALVIWQVNMWHLQQNWLDQVPLPLFLVLLSYLFSRGSLRLYIQEADILFLRQQKDWFDAIVHRGMIISFVRDCLFAGFWFVIVAPFLIRHYGFSWPAVFATGFLGLMIRETMLYAKHLLAQRLGGFANILMQCVFLICFVGISGGLSSQVYVFSAIDAIFTVIFVYFIKLRLQKQGSFLADIEQEQQARWRLASLLLSQVIEKDKKTVFSRKHPYLFPHSGRLFRKTSPVHRLTEVYIKLFLRNMSRMPLYVILLLMMTTFVIITPIWLKWGGWVAVLPLITDYLRGHVKESADHTFMQLWQWLPETKQKAGELTLRLLLSPAAIIYGGVLGAVTFPWFGVVIGALGGLMLAYPIAGLLAPRY